jgi:hypothetical protein
MQFPQWNYCSPSGTGLICWYNSNPSVKDCTSAPPYYNLSSCPPKYNNYKLYSDKQTCIDNICVPKTCSDLGYTCGTAYDGCGTQDVNKLNCGDCTSTQTCTANKCVDSGCPSGQTKCDDGVCRADCGGTNETGDKSISLTEDVYNDATPYLILSSVCKFGADCSKTMISDIDEDSGLTAENYTVTCKFTSSISKNIQNSFYAVKPDYKTICALSKLISFTPGFGGMVNFVFGDIISSELCGEKYATLGTCRATQKPSSISYCQFTEWASLGIFKDQTKCKDGLYTLLIGLAILVIGIPLLTKK